MRAPYLRTGYLRLSVTLVTAAEESDESKTIEKIELLGGKVTRDDESPDHPVTGSSDLQGSSKFGDKYCHLLRSFSHLTTINVGDTHITDAGLKGLNEQQHLTDLSLNGTQITDAGLNEVRHCKNLTSLELLNTKVTVSGMTDLCKSLPNLRIYNEPAAIQRVQQLGGRILRVDKRRDRPVITLVVQSDGRLSENDLYLLGEFRHVTTLTLQNTPITDAGLKQVRHLKKLKRLSLWNIEITDAGLKELGRSYKFERA